jgi:acyl-CoA thioesterase FadM
VQRGGDSLFAARVTVALVDAQGRPRRVPRDMAKAMALLPQSGSVTQT